VIKVYEIILLMQEEDKLFLNRIKDLAEGSYTQNRYTFTQFLTVEEQALVESIRADIKHVDYDFYGGNDSCERQVLRFGSFSSLGYEEDFPITVILIEPLIDKFSDDLTHRDFLGSLMNLGIKRNVIGDILIKGKKAYVFCLDEVADYIISELTRIKHTSVKLTKIEGKIDELERKLEDMSIIVSSPRFDAVVAALTKLSRSKVIELFREKKVLLNNRICENNSLALKPGSTISIRGYGKYIFESEGGVTRKDRVYLNMRKYI